MSREGPEELDTTTQYVRLTSTSLSRSNTSRPTSERRGSLFDLGSGSVANPRKSENRSLSSLAQLERLEILNEMRPVRLVGRIDKLFDWDEGLVDLRKKKNESQAVKDFYRNQNELIERYKEIDNLLDSGIHVSMLQNYSNDLEQLNEEAETTKFGTIASNISRLSRHGVPGNIDLESAPLLGYDKEAESGEIVFAILLNFAINFVLLIGKIIVCFLTSSISIVASLIDSVLDFLSTTIIYFSNKLSQQNNWKTRNLYPIGRSRLEPLGVLIFSVIIIISFLQVGQESIKRLFFNNGNNDPVAIGISSTSIMILTILTKLGCWLWCKNSKSSSVQALAQDAMTDIVFNTFSILMPLLGYHMKIWWLDPLGALLLSIYIIVSWSFTAFEHIDNLTGASGSLEDQKVILYLCFRFADSIKRITNLNVYHVGDNLNVEIDLVMDTRLSLRDAHDIGEALQYAIETLPMVERAFVHLDYRVGNYRGHLV